MTRIKEPLMPGKIMAQMAMAPDPKRKAGWLPCINGGKSSEPPSDARTREQQDQHGAFKCAPGYVPQHERDAGSDEAEEKGPE